jgi:hypothetical protein
VGVPPKWQPTNTNKYSASFYKLGPAWVCRNNPLVRYPEELGEWPEDAKGADGKTPQEVLDRWKEEIEKAWTDVYDLKRRGCKSSKPECCRYRVKAEITFEETGWLGGHDLVIGYEAFRSDATLWSLGDDRWDFLAPHEFGHLLGAPDEYEGQFSTQLGNNSGGMKDGVDPTSLMGGGKVVKLRHFRGICEVMAKAVEGEYGKRYTYDAVGREATIALPAGTAKEKDKAVADAQMKAVVLGSLAGAAVGALAGAAAGGWKSWQTAAVGGVAGAAAGAGIGWLMRGK